MRHLLYLHGFLSSPASGKAVAVRDWLANYRPDVHYHCPQLSPHPRLTRELLDTWFREHASQGVGLMGSSLGGYWATWLSECHDLRAVLINPATEPDLIEHGFLEIELTNYHTGETYRLDARDADDLRAVATPAITRHANYLLLTQSGDETLDYRLAVAKYAGCRQIVEPGGSHSFEDFERHIPAAIDFLNA